MWVKGQPGQKNSPVEVDPTHQLPPTRTGRAILGHGLGIMELL